MSHSFRVGLVTASSEVTSLVRESLALFFPSAELATATAEKTGTLPECACIIVDATSAVDAGEIARRLRAGASTSALVFIVAARDEGLAARGAAVGALEQIELRAMSSTLGEAIERAIGGARWEGELAAARDELRRAQRLAAAGDVALGLQHAMNNPLTAVLAEAQLLEMEELPDEAMTAVTRIIENTRRLVALVRKLDVVSAKRAAKQG